MSAIANEDLSDHSFDRLKNQLKTIWMTGNYDLFSRYMEGDAEVYYQRLGIPRGSSLLDVGCGAGQLALIAARSGARVTGCDISSNWLARARERALAEGLAVKFDEGDAEDLPYEDGAFEVVTTLFGAMFAPRPDLVAAELTRVCRPGGLISMANWKPNGFVGLMFKTMARYVAPASMPSPILWGDEDTVRDRLSDGISQLKFSSHVYHLAYPFSPRDVVSFYRTNYGPVATAFASLHSSGQRLLQEELVKLWSDNNTATDGTTIVESEYLQVVATRGRGEEFEDVVSGIR